VSARISSTRHEELRDRCNKVGCSINEYLSAALDLALTGHSRFDFDLENDEEESQESSKAEDQHQTFHVKLQ
jgi:hypothetical protein